MRRPLLGACLLFVLLVLSFYICVPFDLPDESGLDGQKLRLTGEVVQIETKEYFGTTNILYTLKDVRVDERMAGACYGHDQIYCYTTEKFENTYIGTKIAVMGDFSSFKGAENPGSFDSQFYYHILRVGGSLKDTQLISSDGAVAHLRNALHRLRLYFIQKTDQLFSEPYNGIVQAVLLGYKGNLDADIKQLYKEGGMLHIMTISGMHISMLGMGCVWLLKKLRVPAKVSAVLGAAVVVLYGLMIGMQVATLRAVIMFCMRMLAKLLGRTYDAKTALGVSAVVLLLMQPMYLFHSGFLLSYGSVFGMVVMTPVLGRVVMKPDAEAVRERKRKLWNGVVTKLIASVGILLATLPIQLYFFYEYSLYSIWINFIVLPLLPYVVGVAVVVLVLPVGATKAMIMAGGTPSVLAKILRVVAGCLVWVVERLLGFYEWVCHFFEKMPAHIIVAGAPKGWQIIGYYVVLAVCLIGMDYLRRKDVMKQKGLSVVGVLSSVLLILFWRPLEAFQCHFLSVGQGDCAVIREDDITYLVDCGSSSKKNIAEDVLLPFLKYYGVSEVEGVFLSHADEDHINGITQWLEDYEHSHIAIKSVILPALDATSPLKIDEMRLPNSRNALLQAEFGEVLSLCEMNDIPVFTVGKGDKVSLGNLQWEVLNPETDNYEGGMGGASNVTKNTNKDSNEQSQVLLAEYKGYRILFAGDISSNTEAELLTDLPKQPITILKVAHHGSKYSTSEAFLHAAQPKVAILSYGEGNSYGHPHKEVLERLSEGKSYVMETAKCGAITVMFDEQVEIATFLE